MTQGTSRFKKIYAEGTNEGTEIWVDRMTGVNYVFHFRGYAEGFTPLLDAEGRPIVTPFIDETEFCDGKKVS